MTIISQVQQNRKTVLAIDDDPFVTEFISLILARLGYHALTADNGTSGLAYAVKHRPDAILLDLAMPEVDGFQVLNHRKKMPEIADTPIIVLSASHTQADVQRALDLGATGYITKPFDLESVARRLERIVPSPLFAPRDPNGIAWGAVPAKSLL